MQNSSEITVTEFYNCEKFLSNVVWILKQKSAYEVSSNMNGICNCRLGLSHYGNVILEKKSF